nr:MAG TPA: hypothetical protein [Circoviridae sp.]
MDKLIALDPCQKVPNKKEKGVGVRLNFFIDVLTLMCVRSKQIVKDEVILEVSLEYFTVFKGRLEPYIFIT